MQKNYLWMRGGGGLGLAACLGTWLTSGAAETFANGSANQQDEMSLGPEDAGELLGRRVPEVMFEHHG